MSFWSSKVVPNIPSCDISSILDKLRLVQWTNHNERKVCNPRHSCRYDSSLLSDFLLSVPIEQRSRFFISQYAMSVKETSERWEIKDNRFIDPLQELPRRVSIDTLSQQNGFSLVTVGDPLIAVVKDCCRNPSFDHWSRPLFDSWSVSLSSNYFPTSSFIKLQRNNWTRSRSRFRSILGGKGN